MNNKQVQERLLREEDLDLDKAIQIGRAAEEVKEKTQEMRYGSATKITMQIDKISCRKRNSRKADKTKLRSQQESETGMDIELEYITRCKYCGELHKYGRCPESARMVIREIILKLLVNPAKPNQ